MESVTKPQLTKIHILLNKLQLIDDKKAIIKEVTKGRATSSKDLTFAEAKFLISRLCDCDPTERLKTVINQLAFRAGIIYGETETDKILNKVKLDLFFKNNGSVKKDLHKQSYTELTKTHRQFEAIVKGIAKSKEHRQAEKAVRELLTELNLILSK
ncbi:hypothetical protein [Mucilaginibacter sp.]|uniref:hypothetical protein n=1 Tax=Mucilaginibacter sp. TaxID=1882438 RepID=UPI0025E88A5E|nr:hypothetical protein [Mucilaginibacter sp.]